MHLSLATGLHAIVLGLVVNLTLAIVKIVTGVVGHSYALIADGIESTSDIFSSLIVWSGLRLSMVPPDAGHPYGHGKAESLAAGIAALGLIAAAVLIAVQSTHEIYHGDQSPAWFTLPVLIVIVAVKEFLSQYIFKIGNQLDSTSLQVDAWHHRSDALTSAAVAVGIAIALLGGPDYASADDWAALFTCGLIAFNGLRLLKRAIDEMMDATARPDIHSVVRQKAQTVEGVLAIEKCRIRKSGPGFLMDIHVQVTGTLTVTEGHCIAHRVKDHLMQSELNIQDVVVHIEPKEENAFVTNPPDTTC